MRRSLSPRWRLVLVVLGFATLLRLPSLFHQLYDVDEAAIAAQGIVVRGGGTLYVDAVDRKPPLVPLLYGAMFKATDGNDLRPLHGLATAGLAAVGLMAAADASRSARTRHRHLGPGELRLGPDLDPDDAAPAADAATEPEREPDRGAAAGTATAVDLRRPDTPPAAAVARDRNAWWAAGLVMTGLVTFFPVDAQAANFAHFAVVPGTLAIVAARRGRARWALVSGIALGLAVVCRQTWVLGLAPAMLGAALASRRRWHGLLVPVGAVLPVAAIAGVVPFGAFVHWTFTGNGSFVLAASTVTGALGRGAASTAIFVVGHATLCWLLVVRMRDDFVFVRGRFDARRDVISAAREADADLWLWLATGVAAAVLGFRFYGHYWLQTVPPAALLAAPVAARLAPRWDRIARWGVAAPTAVAFTLACIPGTVRPVFQPDDLVAYVQRTTEPGQPVMVWGNLPQLDWKADRPLGGGLVHMDFVTGLSGGRQPNLDTVDDATEGAQQALLDELADHPPELILDTSTADLHGYRAYPISAFPKIQAVLTAHYTPVAVVDDVTVYRLRPGL